MTAPAKNLFSRTASTKSTLPSIVVSPQIFSDDVPESVVTVVVSVVSPETSVVSVVSVTVVVSVVSPETSVVSVVSVVVVVVGASGSLNEMPELFA